MSEVFPVTGLSFDRHPNAWNILVKLPWAALASQTSVQASPLKQVSYHFPSSAPFIFSFFSFDPPFNSLLNSYINNLQIVCQYVLIFPILECFLEYI